MDTTGQGRPDPSEKARRQRRKYLRWTLLSTLLTFSLSFIINLLSEVSIDGAPPQAAILVLFLIVLIGVLFDMIGTAVTAAEEAPFHSMAAKRVKGAATGIKLIKNAERVSNICNDVIGDICGIVSGSTTAVIVARLVASDTAGGFFSGIALTAFVAALTVGGKAFGKSIAISSSNNIVYAVAKILSVFEKDSKNGKKNKKNTK